MRFLLILLCACRVSWSTWQGAPPRSANNVTMTLYAVDESSMTMVRSVLQRDPHITLVEFDPTVIEKQKTDCGSASCPAAVAAACSWSALQGAEYYALAAVGASFTSGYECTQYKGDLFAKHDECVAGHVTNEQTTASYTLDVYEVKTCEKVPALSQKMTAHAQGPEEQSKPAALASLGAQVPAKSEGLPDQIAIDANGRIAGDARDGYYALFRDGHYRGYVRARDPGTPAESLRPMYCCLSPQPGDALVARGRRKFLDLAVDGVIGQLTFDGERKIAGGIGAHVRHYALDGGLQYGFGVDYLGSVATKSNIFLFTPEVGWGIPIAPGFVVSANLGVGFARANQVIESMNDAVPWSLTGHVVPSARVQTFLTTWFYLTGDVGFAFTGTFDSWESDGAPAARPMTMRSPIVRLYAGFDI
ncbi:MAG TPA: hypothetical protein VFV99_11795 [Kofleriaceae bacterium]|nr:hypothetical protein [Kofleriaceae bacterium]